MREHDDPPPLPTLADAATGHGISRIVRGRAWPVSLAALTVGSILLWLPALRLPIDVDATSYAVAARWWARGDTLYEQFTITRPQGILLLYRLSDAIGLGSTAGLRFTGALFCALAALMLCLFAARIWGRAVGLGAAIIYALIMATPILEGPAANAEVFMMGPLLASMYLLLRADEHALGSPRNLWLLVASGLCGAVALLIKPSAGVALPFACVWLARRCYRERATPRAWCRVEFVYGLSFAAGLVPALAHGFLTAPDVYLHAAFLHRLQTKSGASEPLIAQLGRFFYMTGQVLLRLPILLVATGGIGKSWRGGNTRQRDLLVLWLLTSLGGAWLGGNWWLHYYQQLLPPLAVAAVLGLRSLPWGLGRGLRVAFQQSFVVIGIASLALTLLLGLAVRGNSVDVLVGNQPYLHDFEPVAAYLRAHSADSDTLYVAYENPEIYYLSDLRPTVRWPFSSDLTAIPGSLEAQIAQLADPAMAPTYIVEAQPFERLSPRHGLTLRDLVERDYALASVVDGVAIYRRIGPPAGQH